MKTTGSSLGIMSIFFAVLSTIDPDQLIVQVQTPAAAFETPLLQVKWSRNEVLFLLSLYKERENFFKDKKSKKKTLWEEISKEMQEKGYGYTGAQCETKFKNLKQNFTKTVDHNNVSGNDKKTCPYFEELSDIFGMTPSVKPVAVCSNRAGPVGEDLIRTSSSSGSFAEAAASSTDGRRPSLDNEETLRREVKRSRAKRALQSKESLTDLFKEYQREQREKEEEKEKHVMEMHQQKMQRFDRLLELFEKDISK